MEILRTVLISIIGSAAVFGFIQFLISRNDQRNDDLKEIKDGIKDLQKETKKLKKDSVRSQLLTLIILQPDEEKEILDLAQHYFCDLKGNWYMSPLFYKWCQKKKISPEWFHYTQGSEETD